MELKIKIIIGIILATAGCVVQYQTKSITFPLIFWCLAVFIINFPFNKKEWKKEVHFHWPKLNFRDVSLIFFYIVFCIHGYFYIGLLENRPETLGSIKFVVFVWVTWLSCFGLVYSKYRKKYQ